MTFERRPVWLMALLVLDSCPVYSLALPSSPSSSLLASSSYASPHKTTKWRRGNWVSRTTATRLFDLNNGQQEQEQEQECYKAHLNNTDENLGAAIFAPTLVSGEEEEPQQQQQPLDGFNYTLSASSQPMLPNPEMEAYLEQEGEPTSNQNKRRVSANTTTATTTTTTTKNKLAVFEGAPTIRTIIQFAIPALGVWLCSPLLSLIDTSAVGLLSGTTQQAALNPATAVTDYAALLIAFLYTGTTNLVAAARGREKQASTLASSTNATTTEQTVIGSVQLSWAVGLCFGATLFALAGKLVGLMIGRSDPAVFEAATRYVRIRSLGMPAAAMMGTAQSACLGLKDARSPLYVLLAAAVVNLFGDMALVGRAHPWLGGAAGAAWATVFSQYAAAGLFAQWLFQPRRPTGQSTDEVTSTSISANKSKQIGTKTAGRVSSSLSWIPKPFGRRPRIDSPPKATNNVPEARGFLSGKGSQRQLFKLPSRAVAKAFSPYVLPVTSTQFGRVSSYATMSHVISSSLGLHAMAAQQVIMSLFYSFCPICDSLSLTAQSFVPAISEQAPSRERARALQKTMTNLFRVGVIFSLLLLVGVSNIPNLARFSTSDAHVLALVGKATPYVVGTFSVHSFVLAFEGLLLARKDLSFIANWYLAWFFVVPYFLLRVKKAALEGTRLVGLNSVWGVFMLYQFFRFATWTWRALLLQRRTNREAEMLQGTDTN